MSIAGGKGADVAMLMRRVRQRAGRHDLLCIGTSATLASGDSRAETKAKIAEVGSRFFGVTVKSEHDGPETTCVPGFARLVRRF